MPFFEDAHTDLRKVLPGEVAEMHTSVNTPLVAFPERPSEETKAYLLSFWRGGKLYLHIFLHMVHSGEGYIYSHDANPFEEGQLPAYLDEAMQFVETMGFIMENAQVGHLDDESRMELFLLAPFSKAAPRALALKKPRPESMVEIDMDLGEAASDEAELERMEPEPEVGTETAGPEPFGEEPGSFDIEQAAAAGATADPESLPDDFFGASRAAPEEKDAMPGEAVPSDSEEIDDVWAEPMVAEAEAMIAPSEAGLSVEPEEMVSVEIDLPEDSANCSVPDPIEVIDTGYSVSAARMPSVEERSESDTEGNRPSASDESPELGFLDEEPAVESDPAPLEIEIPEAEIGLERAVPKAADFTEDGPIASESMMDESAPAEIAVEIEPFGPVAPPPRSDRAEVAAAPMTRPTAAEVWFPNAERVESALRLLASF